MKKIIYTVGDATKPEGAGSKIIAHVCNDMGAWGRGFVLAISKLSPAPERGFREWYRDASITILRSERCSLFPFRPK